MAVFQYGKTQAKQHRYGKAFQYKINKKSHARNLEFGKDKARPRSMKQIMGF